MRKIGTPYASIYSPQGFRRDATQELKSKGSQCPHRAGVGEWMSLAFRCYIDSARDVGRDMSKLLIGSAVRSNEEVPTAGNGPQWACETSVGDGARYLSHDTNHITGFIIFRILCLRILSCVRKLGAKAPLGLPAIIRGQKEATFHLFSEIDSFPSSAAAVYSGTSSDGSDPS